MNWARFQNVEMTLSADPAAQAASDNACSVSSGRSVPLGRPESRPAYSSVTGRDSPVFNRHLACARTCNRCDASTSINGWTTNG